MYTILFSKPTILQTNNDRGNFPVFRAAVGMEIPVGITTVMGIIIIINAEIKVTLNKEMLQGHGMGMGTVMNPHGMGLWDFCGHF